MRFCVKFIPLLMLSLLCACAREEWPAGETIRFSVDGVSAELETKAVGPDTGFGLTETEKNSIVLWGEMTLHATTPNWSAATPVFTNTQVVKDGTVWKYWGTGLPERWTRTNDYRFRTVYPATADVNLGESSSAMLTVDYSMFENEERDANNQVTKRKGNYDLMVTSATVTDAATRTDAVPLQFHHACAVVRVLFKTATSNTYLTDFSLQNVYTLGTLNYSGDGTTGVSMNEWTLHDTRAPQVFPWTGEAKSSSLVFVADLTPGSEKVTVTTSGEAPGPIDEASVWLEFGDGKRVGMTPDSDDPTDPASSIYRVKVVDFVSTWGFHFLVGNRGWGGNGILLSLGEDYPIAKNGKDINFAYRSGFTSYWTVPTDVYEGFGCYYVIPQNLNIDDGLRPAVTFTYALGQMSIPTTLPLPVVNNDTSIKWEAGKVYVYNIQIQPETTITVSVEDWESFYVTTDDLIFTDD